MKNIWWFKKFVVDLQRVKVEASEFYRLSKNSKKNSKKYLVDSKISFNFATDK